MQISKEIFVFLEHDKEMSSEMCSARKKHIFIKNLNSIIVIYVAKSADLSYNF